VPNNLALNSVVVTRERLPLENDLVALLIRPIKASHHKMKVGCEGVHNDDLVRRRADDIRRSNSAVLGEILP
jgi:hypothetical protein